MCQARILLRKDVSSVTSTQGSKTQRQVPASFDAVWQSNTSKRGSQELPFPKTRLKRPSKTQIESNIASTNLKHRTTRTRTTRTTTIPKLDLDETLHRLRSNDSTLTELRLNVHDTDDYYIGDEGGKAIADALEDNYSLKGLSLGQNLGGYGKRAIALAEALEENNTLESLNFCNNKIEAEGTKALVNALTKNNTLAYLWLDGNKIGDEFGNQIQDLLARSKNQQ